MDVFDFQYVTIQIYFYYGNWLKELFACWSKTTIALYGKDKALTWKQCNYIQRKRK